MHSTCLRAAIGIVFLFACAVGIANGADRGKSDHKVRHVLLLSLDGFHPLDLDYYRQAHPASTLAALVTRGVNYTNATTSSPSDSFPGTLAMVTGGSPVSTGIYYDVSWDHDLSPARSDCSTRGTVVPYNETINVANARVTTIDPDKLPRDPARGCVPVFPHEYLHVNTIYEVIKAAGLRTAAAEGAEFDVIYHETPSFNEFGRIAEEQGLKAALAWRDEPFGDGHGKK
jgi:hypothetical protein